jgi:DNA-binding GntR family transcriptional regulator
VPQQGSKSNVLKRNENHTRKAYEGIQRMLFYNEIVPGQKISYRDLSERLGMSQTPVIQALKWLEFQHLVRHEPNRGYYTAPVSLQEVEEIYDLRELIELELLRRSLAQMDESGLQRLKQALDAHLEASKDFYLYDRLSKDMEFHLILASLSGCLVHQGTLKNLFDLLYLKYGGKFLFASPMESAGSDHQALFELISRGDGENARQLLSAHIRRVRNHVLESVGKTLAATRF